MSRNIITSLVTLRNAQLGSPHFIAADWHAYSAGHEDWFGAGDIHHTEAGKRAYRSFITWYLALASNGEFGC